MSEHLDEITERQYGYYEQWTFATKKLGKSFIAVTIPLSVEPIRNWSLAAKVNMKGQLL